MPSIGRCNTLCGMRFPSTAQAFSTCELGPESWQVPLASLPSSVAHISRRRCRRLVKRNVETSCSISSLHYGLPDASRHSSDHRPPRSFSLSATVVCCYGFCTELINSSSSRVDCILFDLFETGYGGYRCGDLNTLSRPTWNAELASVLVI